MMNRLLVRRCSMSSIEEEDESEISGESLLQTDQSESCLTEQVSFNRPLSTPEWDSELSESEQEFDDNSENLQDTLEEQAANRAIQCFKQSCSRTYQPSMNNRNNSHSPFSIHLYEPEKEEDSTTEIDVILSELEDFKFEFEENSNFLFYQQRLSNPKHCRMERSTMNNCVSSPVPTRHASSFSTSGCVSELRTLEDQLEAALASLSLTINDCTTTRADSQHANSSDSSACSSGIGDEIGNETFNSYRVSNAKHSTTSYTAKQIVITDDCDSAFSECGSNEKVTLTNQDESFIYRSLLPMTEPILETSSLVIDHDDALLSQARQPQKILVRTYNDDESTKSIFIDDSMLIRDVLYVLIHKNHREPDINYALVESLPELHMERIFEDHQKLAEAILMWPTESSNRLYFTKRIEKYSFFRTANMNSELPHAFDIEGNIYLKEKSRKSWKKHFCVLRPSGLYFIPKGKSKKDLVCLAKFENVELFLGLDWKKKFKSPSDFCFALKHPLIQKKSSKYIKYMCVETKAEFDRWITNIRTAKFGQQLKSNYLYMEKTMNTYCTSGRFTSVSTTTSEIPIEQIDDDHQYMRDCKTSISASQYIECPPKNSNIDHNNYTEKNDTNENSPIKSASYMDELRQRLERVLKDSSEQSPKTHQPKKVPSYVKETVQKPKLIPPPKLKPTNSLYLNSTESLNKVNNVAKPSIIVGSTPLPRKQIQSFGSLSYRTMNSTTNRQHPSQMSKSFIIPSKREEHRSTGSLSTTSKTDSIRLDHSDEDPSSSNLLDSMSNNNRVTNSIGPKPIVNTNVHHNYSKPLPSLKKPTVTFRTNNQAQSSPVTTNNLIPVSPKLSNAFSQVCRPIKPVNSSVTITAVNSNKNSIPPTLNRSVPPIPPRKSSIPRLGAKPQPPERNSSTRSLRKPHITHV